MTRKLLRVCYPPHFCSKQGNNLWQTQLSTSMQILSHTEESFPTTEKTRTPKGKRACHIPSTSQRYQASGENTEGRQKRWWEKITGDKAFPLDYHSTSVKFWVVWRQESKACIYLCENEEVKRIFSWTSKPEKMISHPWSYSHTAEVFYFGGSVDPSFGPSWNYYALYNKGSIIIKSLLLSNHQNIGFSLIGNIIPSRQIYVFHIR